MPCCVQEVCGVLKVESSAVLFPLGRVCLDEHHLGSSKGSSQALSESPSRPCLRRGIHLTVFFVISRIIL